MARLKQANVHTTYINETAKQMFKIRASLDGHCSCQWRIYRDFLSGSVVSHQDQYREFWSINMIPGVHFYHLRNLWQNPLNFSGNHLIQIGKAGYNFTKERLTPSKVEEFVRRTLKTYSGTKASREALVTSSSKFFLYDPQSADQQYKATK